jgi:hypothetical protein
MPTSLRVENTMSEERPPLTVNGYVFSSELFEKGFPQGGGPCTCSSVCCEDGVFADIADRERILSHRELIKRSMDETQTRDEARWFEQEEQEDDDFPSGRCVGTETFNGKCVFLDKFGRCSLQVAAVSEGMHKWSLKPFFCVLYPIEVSGKVVSFDNMLQDEQSCCSIGHQFDVPLFEGCKEELTYLVGPEGYQKIEGHFAALQATTDTTGA